MALTFVALRDADGTVAVSGALVAVRMVDGSKVVVAESDGAAFRAAPTLWHELTATRMTDE